MTVESLLSQLGIRYRLIEDEAVARCPYHKDNNPSWSINVNNGLHYCFACGAKGTAATLIRDFLGYSYAESVILANEIVGHARMDNWREDHESVSFSPMSLKVTEADMALFTSPPEHALDHKNVSSEAAKHFDIRWNPKNESWIFPFHDPYSGELWGWQEKNSRIFRNFPAGTKKSKTLFGIDKMESDIAAVVESPVDCAVMYTGFAHPYYVNAVSSFGIPSLYQLSLLRDKRVRQLFFVLDNDSAGKQATAELIPDAVRMFDVVRVVNYEDDDPKDIGELADVYDIPSRIHNAIPALEWIRNV